MFQGKVPIYRCYLCTPAHHRRPIFLHNDLRCPKSAIHLSMMGGCFSQLILAGELMLFYIEAYPTCRSFEQQWKMRTMSFGRLTGFLVWRLFLGYSIHGDIMPQFGTLIYLSTSNPGFEAVFSIVWYDWLVHLDSSVSLIACGYDPSKNERWEILRKSHWVSGLPWAAFLGRTVWESSGSGRGLCGRLVVVFSNPFQLGGRN